MKLIIISPSQKKESELPHLLFMLENGLSTYHLRKTKFSTKELHDFIVEIPEKYHKRLVIHTHHELALKFNLKGIYISSAHKKNKIRNWIKMTWFSIRKKDLQISGTARSIDNVLLKNLDYDYIFLSPVYDSLVGSFQGGFTENTLKILLKKSKTKVIARGGITPDVIEKSHKLGFSGVAFYSSIWKSKNPSETFTKIISKFNELNLPIE